MNDPLAHAGACIWAGLLGLLCFLCMALVGYTLGVEAAQSGRGLEALDLLAQSYPLTDLLRLGARLFIEAGLLAWAWHFNAHFLSAGSEHFSRSLTRMLLFTIVAVFTVEALDSYLYWIVLK